MEDVHETVADSGPSEASATTPVSEASTPYSGNASHKSVRKRKGVPNDEGTTDVMKLVGKKLESLQAEDAFQVFGKHVANKLGDKTNFRRFIRSRAGYAYQKFSNF